MNTYLYIISGALKGYKLKVQPGFTIGREGAHYNLKDPKTSDIHCIVAEKQGDLYLVDNDSKNGLWADGHQVKHVALKNKLRLKIGRTHIEVRQKTAGANLKTTPKSPKIEWPTALQKEIHRLKTITTNSEEESQCQVFMPPVKLTFMSGVQTDDLWTLGYGPRTAGSAGHELNILEESCPEKCFTLSQTDDGCLLTTEHKDAVRVNGKNVTEYILKENDEIEVPGAKLKVEFYQ